MKKEWFDKIGQLHQESQKGGVRTYEGLLSKFTISEKAHEQELIACGSYFDFKLPVDLVAFLRKYNGATFYEFEDTGGYRFLSCQELVDENRFQQENFGDDWDEHILLFCQSIGEAEYVGMKIINDDTYLLVDCVMDQLPCHWPKIQGQLYDFIQRLIEQSGRKFWL